MSSKCFMILYELSRDLSEETTARVTLVSDIFSYKSINTMGRQPARSNSQRVECHVMASCILKINITSAKPRDRMTERNSKEEE